jgi:hypothetical protein
MPNFIYTDPLTYIFLLFLLLFFLFIFLYFFASVILFYVLQKPMLHIFRKPSITHHYRTLYLLLLLHQTQESAMFLLQTTEN